MGTFVSSITRQILITKIVNKSNLKPYSWKLTVEYNIIQVLAIDLYT